METMDKRFTNSAEVFAITEKKKRNDILLRPLREYMESLGNPQDALRCLHVAGTNGKGSVSNACAQILMAAGYRVGLFTSPYLETHHDRIRINDKFIEEETIVAYANRYFEDWMRYGLSSFEIDMAIACLYFKERKVDFAVFEVGLGGTRDATNLIFPEVSIITNIGMDHMEYLGNTYASIAREKAGIVKANVPLLTMEERAECVAVFQEVCAMKHSELIQVAKPTKVYVDTMLHFDCALFKNVEQPTLASYQAENSTLALAAIDYLRKHGLVSVSDAQMREGIRHSNWKGRFECVMQKPLVIVDGAHNLEGINALVEACKPFKKIRILFTALKDKPYGEMLERLLAISDDVNVTTFDFYRASDPYVIKGDRNVQVYEDYQEGIEAILNRTNEGELFLICGSLYFISVVREYFKQKGA